MIALDLQLLIGLLLMAVLITLIFLLTLPGLRRAR